MIINIGIRRGLGPAAILAAGLGLSACSVSGDAFEVSVEHPTLQPLIGQLAVERHCAEYGKSAVHLQTSARRSSILALGGRVSLYQCVAR